MIVKSTLKYNFILFFFIAFFFNLKINSKIDEEYVFMIDTGSNKYASKYFIHKNEDIHSENWLNIMLKKDAFRDVTYQIINDKINKNTKYSIKQDTDFVFCTCDYRNKESANFSDFKCNKYNKDVTKELLNNSFKFNSEKFYYFFILKKDDYNKLFNTNFSKVEVFNENLRYSNDVNRDKVLYVSKNKSSLGTCKINCSLEERIIECIKNNFKDFLNQEDDLRRDLFFAKEIKLKEIFSTPFENITSILAKLASNNDDNVLSIELKYKDEVDIKLVFETPNGYNLKIDKSECTIHFNIKERFTGDTYKIGTPKRSITDIININTVREELEKKDFKIDDKTVKLPSSCFDVNLDKNIFDQYIIKIKIPKDEKNENDKTILLDKFLSEIPKEIKKKQKKHYSCEKKEINR